MNEDETTTKTKTKTLKIISQCVRACVCWEEKKVEHAEQ